LLKNEIVRPLDYILNFNGKTGKIMRRMSRRRNVLKNIVARILKEVHILKKKPKLSELLNAFRGQPKKESYNKLMKLYAKEPFLNNEEDPRYDILQKYFNRLQKNFNI